MSITVETSLVHALHRASQAVEAVVEKQLADLGLTSRQATTLMAISGMSKSNQSELVEVTGIDRSTMADILRRLEIRGLIRRPRSKEDARARIVSLTAKGEQVEYECRHVLVGAEAIFRLRLGKGEAPLLAGLQVLAVAPKEAAGS